MQDRNLWPAILFGFLTGWIFKSLLQGETVPAGSIFSGVIALLVGWLIQKGLRRQGELDKIPIEAVGRLCERIEDLVRQCQNRPFSTPPNDPELLVSLRALANEITWLGSVFETLKLDKGDYDLLFAAYLSFKEEMSGGLEAKSGEPAQLIRTQCLVLQWRICHHVLAAPTDIDTLQAVAQKLRGSIGKRKRPASGSPK